MKRFERCHAAIAVRCQERRSINYFIFALPPATSPTISKTRKVPVQRTTAVTKNAGMESLLKMKSRRKEDIHNMILESPKDLKLGKQAFRAIEQKENEYTRMQQE